MLTSKRTRKIIIAVLGAIDALDTNAYGNTIRAHIAPLKLGLFGLGNVSIDLLYTILDQLETNGFVTSTQCPGGPEKDYRPKRVFLLTAKGREAVNVEKKRGN